MGIVLSPEFMGQEAYDAGYKKGRIDRSLDVESMIAQAPEYGDAALGYRHGVQGFPRFHLEPKEG